MAQASAAQRVGPLPPLRDCSRLTEKVTRHAEGFRPNEGPSTRALSLATLNDHRDLCSRAPRLSLVHRSELV
jgi:hypothetical protein